MTLIAAFRCRNDGVLLCADRKEDDTVAVRPFDKIYLITEFPQFQVLIAGSGLTASIIDARIEIHRSLDKAFQEKRDIAAEHRSIIEASLKTTHVRHKEDLKQSPLGLIVVIAPRTPKSIPIIYRSDRNNLIPEPLYVAYGTGKTISDYFADRLYKHGLPDDFLATLAAFILREAENSASGVGLGSDMIFISPGGSRFVLSTDSVKDIQDGIPSLVDAIYAHWAEHIKVPDWLREYAESAASKDSP
jgi:20S proteasome alpha/beta subunit